MPQKRNASKEIKQQMRKIQSNQLSELKSNEKQHLSRKICFQIMQNFYLLDKSVGIYHPFRNEVDVKEIANYPIESLAIPRMHEKSNNTEANMSFHKWTKSDLLLVNKHGIAEPLPGSQMTCPEVLIVPLLAFDRDCHRLGYGGGYYDRFLSKFSGLTIGVAFNTQKVDYVPRETFDIALDCIATENKIYYNCQRFEQDMKGFSTPRS